MAGPAALQLEQADVGTARFWMTLQTNDEFGAGRIPEAAEGAASAGRNVMIRVLRTARSGQRRDNAGSSHLGSLRIANELSTRCLHS